MSYKNIISIPPGKIRIIEATVRERKIIHQWLKVKHPEVHKAGLKSKLFEMEEYGVCMRCYGCKYKYVFLNNYRYGMLKNNKDEYMFGTCPKCDENVTWECNYDGYDEVFHFPRRNIMAFGIYLEVIQKSKHIEENFNISDDQIIEILGNKKIYEIDEPCAELNIKDRKRLGKYIDLHIKLMKAE